MELRSGRFYSSKEGMELRSGLRMDEVEILEPCEEEYEGMQLRSGTILRRQTSFEETTKSYKETELSNQELHTIMVMIKPKSVISDLEVIQQLTRGEIIAKIRENLYSIEESSTITE